MARVFTDILYISLILIFFVACAQFTRWCERLK